MFDEDAAVHDVGDSGRFEDFFGLFTIDTELRPKKAAPELDRFSRHLFEILGAPENIYDVDGYLPWYRQKIRITLLAPQFGDVGVNRNNPIPRFVLQILSDTVRGARRIIGQPDDCNGARFFEHFLEIGMKHGKPSLDTTRTM